jgi:hypothetical protein
LKVPGQVAKRILPSYSDNNDILISVRAVFMFILYEEGEKYLGQ